MADTPRITQPTTAPLQFVERDSPGYCDPATGVCVWPGAVPTESTSEILSVGNPINFVVPASGTAGDQGHTVRHAGKLRG